MRSLWRTLPQDPERAARLAERLRLHPVTGQLLLNRAVHSQEAAARFLQPALAQLEDPWTLAGMEPAARRIRHAIAGQEPVVVFGDSDVDGLTAGVILYEVLREEGAPVRAIQSNRVTDGYGLPGALVQRLCRSSTKLLILVDCGTNQPEDIRRLSAHGIDTIIVDHHVPLGEPARPHALINPHCAGGGAGRGLSSAGLAFKLAQALLEGSDPERLARHLDLAALGTLADCCPLLGDARILVTAGLPRIVHSHRAGLRRLCQATRTEKPDPEHVIRRLIPRLNASGRLGDARAVWHLLLGRGEDGRLEAWLEASAGAHATTKQLHREVVGQAEAQLSRLHFRDQFVMVIGRSGWPQGLMGALAARLAQRYGRPAITLALGQRHGVGSGRSIPRFNLFEALRACQGLLVRFGGHAQACGLTVERQALDRFREAVNEHGRRVLGRDGLLPTRMVDVELPLSGLARRWVEETQRFAPFGQGNPRPTAAIRRVAVEVKSPRRAELVDGSTRLAARGPFEAVEAGTRYDVLASPSLENGRLLLTVSDLRAIQATTSPGG
jgi:single-stranded-DNA-specific exonuclease